MPTRKLGINLVVIVAVAALFTGLWALYNRPVSAPDWPEQISGFSFSPFRVGQSPMTGVYPSDEQIRADLELLSQQTDNIRTYSVDGKLAVKKDGGDVDALTAATISSRAYVDAINRAWMAYKSVATGTAPTDVSSGATSAAGDSAEEQTNGPAAQEGGQNE